MSQINWKLKYEQLKLKFMNSMDMAYRIGFEDGDKSAQMDAIAQQQAMQQQDMQQDGNEEGQEFSNDQDQNQDGMSPEGSELDQHIGQLEQMMMGKSEISVEDLKKSLLGIKKIKEAKDLKKSMNAIKNIKSKTLSIPVKVNFEIGKKAQSNLNDNAKSTLSAQEKIVSEIMKSWEKEESKASDKIAELAKIEELTKKE